MIRPGDLRLRLVSALAAILLMTPVAGLGPAACYLGLVLALVLAAERTLPWRRLLHLEAFLVLLFLTLPFTIPGETLFRIGPLAASREGVLRVLVLAAKVSGSVLLLSLFFARAEPARLGAALRALGLPEAMVRIFLGLVRYLGLIRAEFARLQDAMRMRAFRPGSNRHTWRSYGNMTGMLLLRAVARAERVDEAMRMRGYAGRFPGSALPPPAAADWLAGAGLVILAGLLLLWDKT
ncbi:cobalt ECF transporter T component CbiQ [Poseidonocella sp. HB161398]|uniref:cobalt ECF transporter T component CbiQ n=1 Tax=Poseidonocella sp. HB161398 TaxID=2320855 RepID=UPI00110A080E|nr:cobalt ECF transporter T component CbiQ [Poseidonocella sp. HB161398]